MYLDTFKLSAKGKQNIRDGAEYLQKALEREGALSWGGAKEVLRKSLIYHRVEDVTLERIGLHGEEQELFVFSNGRSFSKVGDPQPPGFIRDHIDAFVDATTDPQDKKKRGAMRTCLNRIMRDYGDPTIDHDAVTLAQDLNEKTRTGTPEDKDLGTYRSFVRWGIENGLLRGDLRLMVHPEDMVSPGLRRGTARARIQGNSMTNTKGEWLWIVQHPDGTEHRESHTIPGMERRLNELAAQQVDDEEIDFAELIPEEPAEPPTREVLAAIIAEQEALLARTRRLLARL